MAWKFQQLKPQKARGNKLNVTSQWICEEKYDGDRRIAQFCGKVVRFTGCKQSTVTGLFVEKTQNVPHLSGAVTHHPDTGLPVAGRAMAVGNTVVKIQPVPVGLDGTVLDGEMIFPLSEAARAYGIQPGGLSKYVTSIMGSLPDEAVRKQIERGWLRYVVFDCLFFKGADIRHLDLHTRRLYVVKAVEAWGNPYVSLADRTTLYEVRKRDGEGVVYKHPDHTYGNEKLWVKEKFEATADVVIMGFKPAKAESKKKGDTKKTATKYAGLVGSVKIGQYKRFRKRAANMAIVEVGFARGFDDAWMYEFSTIPDAYIGKVIEIKHNGREPTGKFRHPRFSRFRDDKNAKDCVLDLEET